MVLKIVRMELMKKIAVRFANYAHLIIFKVYFQFNDTAFIKEHTVY